MGAWLWLYRPTAPSARAQAIQVVHSAHAVARRGIRVTLAVNPAEPGVTPGDVLRWYGLSPVDGLDLRVLPAGRTAASLAFRALVAGWLVRHPRGVVYARDKRYAAEVLRFAPWARVVLEVHEVDAARGDGAIEARVLAKARGVVANAPGTLEVLGEHHALPAAIVAHNGAVPPAPRGAGRGVAYVGSVRPDKDLDTLARAAKRLDRPVWLVGGEGPDVDRLVALSGGRLRVRGPVPHREIPVFIQSFSRLVLTLGRGVYGERLASPLKLWDYLASGVPVVAADLPSIRAAAPGGFTPYEPGDPESLAAAIRRPSSAPPRVRLWQDRASELVAFVGAVA